jgi:SAM-dependent methyltransferase
MARLFELAKRSLAHLVGPKAQRRHAMVGPGQLWQMKRDFQIRFLREHGLTPECCFLDIGCGTLRGGLPIIEHLEVGRYFGVEVRRKALEEGRKELEESGLEWKKPTLLLCPDIGRLAVPRKFDFIWAFSVLIHMDDAVLHRTLDFVANHLADRGAFYANVNVGNGKDGHWQGFPVVWRTSEFYRQACARFGLALIDLGPLRDHGHVSNVKSQDAQRMLRITKDRAWSPGGAEAKNQTSA